MKIKVVFAISAWLIPFLIGMFFMYYVQQPAIAPMEEELQLAQMQVMQEIARTEQEMQEDENLHEIAIVQAETVAMQEIATRNKKIRNAMLVQDAIYVGIASTGIAIALVIAWNCIVWFKIAFSRSRTMRTVVDASATALVAHASNRRIEKVNYNLKGHLPAPAQSTPVVHIEDPAIPLLPESQLPDFTDLAQVNLPAPSVALLGLLQEGRQLTNKWLKAKHIAIVGPTGGGKSVLSKTLIVQSLRANHDVHILDPHFTRFDAETGEDWTPVTRKLSADPATRIADIESRLDWLVKEMTARLVLREEGQRYMPNIIRVVLDEVPAIVGQSDDAADMISRILREGRKVGVLLQLATQDMLAKTLGFSDGAAVRKNFSTAFIMRDCDPTSSRLFIKDKEFKADYLEVGVSAVVTEGIRGHQIARIPYTSNEAVDIILGRSVATKVLSDLNDQSCLIEHQIGEVALIEKPIAAQSSTDSGSVAAQSSSSTAGSATAIDAKRLTFMLLDKDPNISNDKLYTAIIPIFDCAKSSIRAYRTEWKRQENEIISKD